MLQATKASVLERVAHECEPSTSVPPPAMRGDAWVCMESEQLANDFKILHANGQEQCSRAIRPLLVDARESICVYPAPLLKVACDAR